MFLFIFVQIVSFHCQKAFNYFLIIIYITLVNSVMIRFDEREYFEQRSSFFVEIHEFEKIVKFKSFSELQNFFKNVVRNVIDSSNNYTFLRISKRDAKTVMMSENKQSNFFQLFSLYFSQNSVHIIIKNINRQIEKKRHKMKQKLNFIYIQRA